MDMISGFVQNAAAGAVQAGVTYAGNLAGGFVSSAGDLIEASGRQIGNGTP